MDEETVNGMQGDLEVSEYIQINTTFVMYDILSKPGLQAITQQARCHKFSLPRIKFVLANHRTRNAHLISGNALP